MAVDDDILQLGFELVLIRLVLIEVVTLNSSQESRFPKIFCAKIQFAPYP